MYPSDLKDEEWELIRDFFDPSRDRGKRAKSQRSHIVNTISYIVRTGCQWRNLLRDFPDWPAVYAFFR